jgi:5'-nucleotidase
VRKALLAIAVIAMTGMLLVGCSSSSKKSSTTDTTAGAGATSTTVAAAQTLRILVTNDDGVGAPGISALVEQLRALPNTEVTVVAPAKNQSGTGGKTTKGALTAAAAKTAGGFPAHAVNGFPADTIVWSTDQGNIAETPHLVVSGINFGQNLGGLADISGTVGAARAAADRGIPAVAVSAGLGDKPDYADAAKTVVNWLGEHRAELLARDLKSKTPASVTNINVPTCPKGAPRPEPAIVPAAPNTDHALDTPDCVTPFTNPKTDIEAFIHGYIAQTTNLPSKIK